MRKKWSKLGIIEWNSIVEALLFAAGDEGISLDQIAIVLEVDKTEAADILDELKNSYQIDSRGIHIVEIAGVFQLVTKKIHAPYLQKLVETPSMSALSQAALETLAIIAYKQPISRIEIEEVRGVKVDSPLHKLTTRALIKEVGRAETVGRAILYGTTKEFLDYFGLNSLEELPPLPSSNELDEEETDLFNLKYQERLGELNGDHQD